MHVNESKLRVFSFPMQYDIFFHSERKRRFKNKIEIYYMAASFMYESKLVDVADLIGWNTVLCSIKYT